MRGRSLIMDWVEKNGPPTRRPRKSGFGTRLIDLVIQRQLNGEVIRNYSSEGLSVKMLVPLTHERWPAPAAGPAEKSGKPPDGTASSDPPLPPPLPRGVQAP